MVLVSGVASNLGNKWAWLSLYLICLRLMYVNCQVVYVGG
jgi:hypothetical protein